MQKQTGSAKFYSLDSELFMSLSTSIRFLPLSHYLHRVIRS